MFVFTILIIASIFLLLIPIIVILSDSIETNPTINTNSLKTQKNSTYVNLNYKTGLEYNNNFKFCVPTIYFGFITENSSFETSFNYFTMMYLPPMEMFEQFFTNTTDNSLNKEDKLEQLQTGFFISFKPDLKF